MAEKHWSLDPEKEPSAPWNEWDDYGGCWVCNFCGAAAGYGIHSPTCKRATPPEGDPGV